MIATCIATQVLFKKKPHVYGKLLIHISFANYVTMFNKWLEHNDNCIYSLKQPYRGVWQVHDPDVDDSRVIMFDK